MLCEQEELLFKVGANTILPPNKEIFGPRKAPQNGPTYQNADFVDKMVKWVAYDTWCSTTSTNDQLFQHKMGTQHKKYK